MKHNPLFVVSQFDVAYQFLYGVFRCCTKKTRSLHEHSSNTVMRDSRT